MHREQTKCSLRRPPVVLSHAEALRDYSSFWANLHGTRLGLLASVLFSLVGDVFRFIKRQIVQQRRTP